MITLVDLIAESLSLEKPYIKKLINRSAYYYKTYYIDKPSGGKRRIQHPSPELKTLQYWCIYNIFSKLPVSDYAYAYKKGLSIKHHAYAHLRGRFILHLDIIGFFESINSQHLSNVLIRNKELFMDFDVELSLEEICGICLRKNTLCIGAVCSPIISNVIMYNFDNESAKYCKDRKLTYTRYADDIYISSSEFIDEDILDYFRVKLKEMDFVVNEKKTRFMSSKNRQAVTGLIITHDKNVSVGLNMRNKVKSLLYEKMVKGIGDPEVIMGYMSYIKDIEPMFYNKLIVKYSKYGNVLETISKPEKL